MPDHTKPDPRAERVPIKRFLSWLLGVLFVGASAGLAISVMSLESVPRQDRLPPPLPLQLHGGEPLFWTVRGYCEEGAWTIPASVDQLVLDGYFADGSWTATPGNLNGDIKLSRASPIACQEALASDVARWTERKVYVLSPGGFYRLDDRGMLLIVRPAERVAYWYQS